MLSRAASLHEFLRSIAARERPLLDGSRVVVVVAHPDDETIGCGALLHRLAGVRVVVVTDGAPRCLQDAHQRGFQMAEEYAGARRRELLNVMRLAGVRPDQVMQFGIYDQAAILNLNQITDRLRQFFADQQIGIVLTHAYEGGHPDHDAVAFCVHEAARRVRHTIGILEMPLYRATEAGDAHQSFAPADGIEPVIVELTAEETQRKSEMFAAYVTQQDVLAGFSLDAEHFRSAPEYNFTKPPNGGRVLYDRENWGIRSDGWLRHTREALTEEGAACG
jgi:LmbE family N-acetylglucosaminyl deacetylase